MHQDIAGISRREAIGRTAAQLVLTPMFGFGAIRGAMAQTPSAAPAAVSEEARERHAFIKSAMEEQAALIAEVSRKNAQRGVAAYMRVSTLVPFGDWDYYFVKGGSIYWRPESGQGYQPVNVPEGFVSDLTSIPRLFWQIKKPEGRYAHAAVLHDYLYWTQIRPRPEADLIFKAAMEDSKVDPATVFAIYQVVSKAGELAWDKNQALKKSGERRILKRFPDDFTTSWADWKKRPDVFE